MKVKVFSPVDETAINAWLVAGTNREILDMQVAIGGAPLATMCVFRYEERDPRKRDLSPGKFPNIKE